MKVAFLFLKSTAAVCLAVFMIVVIARAGSLTPSATPEASGYTLADIYTRLTTNEAALAGDHDFSPSGAPDETLFTLTQIYNAIPTIDPATVLFGTTILGVEGEATAGADLTGMYNGTGGVDGGEAEKGGVDDYNGGNEIPDDRFTTEWILCTEENTYCGTGTAYAKALDTATGLVWTHPCKEANCASVSDTDDGDAYTWANAVAYCQNLNVGGFQDWYLPHQKQLLQAYINGAWGILVTEVSRTLWSQTTNSTQTANAYYIGFNGILLQQHIGKTSTLTTLETRCVREI